MSQETLLKKEFKETDLNRIRNIVEKRYGDNTKIQIRILSKLNPSGKQAKTAMPTAEEINNM